MEYELFLAEQENRASYTVAAFLVTSVMCAFHVKSPEIVTPKSLASLTNLMHSSPMTTGGKSQSDVKLMRSSLHLSVFNLTLFLIDQFTTSFTIP